MTYLEILKKARSRMVHRAEFYGKAPLYICCSIEWAVKDTQDFNDRVKAGKLKAWIEAMLNGSLSLGSWLCDKGCVSPSLVNLPVFCPEVGTEITAVNIHRLAWLDQLI